MVKGTYIAEDSCRKRQAHVLGAVDAISKEVFTTDNTTYITADTVKDFLESVRGKNSSIPIVIVMDNARYQNCRTVIDKAETLGIELLFLPPYSPNLNIIERLWKFVKKSVLYGHYYDKPKNFHAAIRDFLGDINENTSIVSVYVYRTHK